MALVGTLVAQLAVGATLDGGGELGLLDGLDGGVGVDDGEGGGGVGDGVGDGLELVLGGVALLGLVALLGEEDQALLVGLEALDVGGQGLLGDVLAASIDGNTDGRGVLAGDTSGLDGALLESSIIASNLPQRAHTVNEVTEDMARRACCSFFFG